MMDLHVSPGLGFKVGDRVIGIPRIDDRNWWQRLMPRWLGGKAAPTGYEDAVIVAVTDGGDHP